MSPVLGAFVIALALATPAAADLERTGNQPQSSDQLERAQRRSRAGARSSSDTGARHQTTQAFDNQGQATSADGVTLRGRGIGRDGRYRFQSPSDRAGSGSGGAVASPEGVASVPDVGLETEDVPSPLDPILKRAKKILIAAAAMLAVGFLLKKAARGNTALLSTVRIIAKIAQFMGYAVMAMGVLMIATGQAGLGTVYTIAGALVGSLAGKLADDAKKERDARKNADTVKEAQEKTEAARKEEQAKLEHRPQDEQTRLREDATSARAEADGAAKTAETAQAESAQASEAAQKARFEANAARANAESMPPAEQSPFGSRPGGPPSYNSPERALAEANVADANATRLEAVAAQKADAAGAAANAARAAEQRAQAAEAAFGRASLDVNAPANAAANGSPDNKGAAPNPSAPSSKDALAVQMIGAFPTVVGLATNDGEAAPPSGAAPASPTSAPSTPRPASTSRAPARHSAPSPRPAAPPPEPPAPEPHVETEQEKLEREERERQEREQAEKDEEWAKKNGLPPGSRRT